MRIMLLGSPGVGKGTQAQFICEHFAIPQISTGNILRAAIDSGSELGQKAKQYLDEGQLVPDEIIIGVIRERLQESDCQQGFLLDGFPRTVPQADALLENGIKLDFVVLIDLSEDEIVRRLSGRRMHLASGRTYHVDYNPPKMAGVDDITGEALVQRDDDKEDVIRKRFEVFHKQTAPLIQYYQKIADETELCFVHVDGAASVEEVKQKIFKELKSNITV